MKILFAFITFIAAFKASAADSEDNLRVNRIEDFAFPENYDDDPIDDNKEDWEIEAQEKRLAFNELCKELNCSPGRECVINENNEASCQCVSECGHETNPRRQVCSNFNETFTTDCDLYRARCLCEDGLTGCEDPEKLKHTHIEYYGACRIIPECTEDELLDFPRRMREWLFNVMQELAERDELSEHYLQLEKEAEEDDAKRWVNAAIWKWCDLDEHPKNNVVSRHELFPVKAPLQALEHCIGDFLNSCDADNDHILTLKEWGSCLGLKEEEMIAECEKL